MMSTFISLDDRMCMNLKMVSGNVFTFIFKDEINYKKAAENVIEALSSKYSKIVSICGDYAVESTRMPIEAESEAESELKTKI